MCGVINVRSSASGKKLPTFKQFKRGVFAKKKIAKGERNDLGDAFFAFPNQDNQILETICQSMSNIMLKKISRNWRLLSATISRQSTSVKKFVSVGQQGREILANANVVVPGKAELEISHHYGIDRFRETGYTIINVINREYCEKLILVLPGQGHPEQYHKIKEETFVVLYGDVLLTLDGKSKECKKGDIVTVDRGVKHIFSSEGGAVIEEIS